MVDDARLAQSGKTLVGSYLNERQVAPFLPDGKRFYFANLHVDLL